MHVRALCEILHQSQPAVSHHLALLRMAGLIDRRRVGHPPRFSDVDFGQHSFAPGRDEQFGLRRPGGDSGRNSSVVVSEITSLPPRAL
jgi:DNA-binding transcriptional ArsR family regulator